MLDRGVEAGSGRCFALNPGSGVLGELAGILQVKLSLNLFAVVLDSLDAQMKFVGDVARFFPAADKLKDFHFAIAQPAHRRLGDVRLATDLALQHFGRQCVTYVN